RSWNTGSGLLGAGWADQPASGGISMVAGGFASPNRSSWAGGVKMLSSSWEGKITGAGSGSGGAPLVIGAGGAPLGTRAGAGGSALAGRAYWHPRPSGSRSGHMTNEPCPYPLTPLLGHEPRIPLVLYSNFAKRHPSGLWPTYVWPGLPTTRCGPVSRPGHSPR